MASKRFYLDKEKKDVIYLKWGLNWKNFTITHQEKIIGRFENKSELLKGNTFQTEDGRNISIKLKSKFSNEFEILLNDEILPGSFTDPKVIVKSAFIVALIIGLLNIIIGALGYFFHSYVLQELGAGIIMLVFGAIITALAFGIKAKSMISLILVTSLYFIDTILWMAFVIESGNDVPTAASILRIVLIIILLRTIPAMKNLKKQEKNKIL